MEEIDSRFLDVFLEEAADILANLENDLIELEKNKTSDEVINKVFRAFHTFKGSSGIIGFNALADYTHHMENLLDEIRNHKRNVDEPLISLFLKAMDVVKSYIQKVKEGTFPGAEFFDNAELPVFDQAGAAGKEEAAEPMGQTNLLLEQLEQSAAQDKQNKELNYYYIELIFREDALRNGVNPLLFLLELKEKGAIDGIDLDESILPDFKGIDLSLLYLKWRVLFKTGLPLNEVEDIFVFVKDGHPVVIHKVPEEEYQLYIKDFENRQDDKLGNLLIQNGSVTEHELSDAMQKQKKLGEILVESGYVKPEILEKALEKQNQTRQDKEKSFIRVSTDKLDNLLNFVSELIISHSRVYSALDKLAPYADNTMELSNIIANLENLTRDIQEQVMSIRMVPLGPTFVQFNRMVRDLAQKESKKVNLKIIGSETELDKNMIEQISDPLKHMMRNAIGHGIETTAERLAAGKPEEGNLVLEAYNKEGNIVIEIRDDGRGLNKNKIMGKAVEKKIIPQDVNLSEKEIFQIIFAPGFSTASEITEVSGRGVGMDVVKQNIEKLKGKVEIQSEEGKGTTFKIILPLTMAIIDGMLVKIKDDYYVFPLLAIVESFKPENNVINSVEGNIEVIEYRNDYIPLIRLANTFFPQIKEKKALPDSILIVVESAGKKYAFQADELVGQQQIVVKSLEKNFTNIEGISGATILGDGKIALILDIEGIVQQLMNSKE